MTIKEAKQEFYEINRGIFDSLRRDKPAFRQAWNDFTDMLCKEHRITERQYDRWLNPFIKRK